MLWPEAATLYIFSQMTFTTPEHLKQHLVNTITTAFIAEVQAKCNHQNEQVDHHKAKGIRWPLTCTGRYVREVDRRLEEKSPVFGWDEPRYYPHYANIVEDAQAQADAACALLEQRIAQHHTKQEYIWKTSDLQVNHANGLIEGRVYGHEYDYIADDRTIEERREATKFEIYVRMIWNYRYGSNSANGHLTTYTQFRSERHGAEMAGKSAQKAKEDAARAERQAKLQAEKDAKKAEKWDRFSKLAVQMEKWSDKKIKTLGQKIAEYDDTIQNLKHNNFDTSNEEHYKKVTAADVERLNTLRNDTRTWQNNMDLLKAIFDEGCDTRPKLVERYQVWGV